MTKPEPLHRFYLAAGVHRWTVVFDNHPDSWSLAWATAGRLSASADLGIQSIAADLFRRLKTVLELAK